MASADHGPHADHLYGRKNPVNLSGMWVKQRARVDPMAEFNNLDRQWRAQHLKDLKLTPNDGWAAHVQTLSAYEKARYNPIRRLGRIPLNMFEKMLIGSGVRHGRARLVRTLIAGAGKGLIATWAIIYVSFNSVNSWESRLGWKVYQSKPEMDPNSEYYQSQKSMYSGKGKDDWADWGFKKSTMYGQAHSSNPITQ